MGYVAIIFLVFLLAVLGLSLISSFAEYLAELDKGIAKWAQGTTSTTPNSYSLDTGLVHYVNEHVDSFIFGPLALLVVLIVYDLFFLKLKAKEHVHHYLYLIVSSVLVYTISYFLVDILKNVFDRPRPWQSIEHHALFDTAPECLVPFQPAFRQYKGENPCDYGLRSMPSGHVQTMFGHTFAMLYMSMYNFKYTGALKNIINKLAHFLIIGLTACIFFVFVPTTMYARLIVLRHHFTDVIAGALCTLACVPALLVFASAPLDEKWAIGSLDEIQTLVKA